MNHTAVVSKGLLQTTLLFSLVTACVAQDPTLRRATMLESYRPADALSDYERIIISTPSEPAAFEARLRAANVLANIHPERARACARLVERDAIDQQTRQSAEMFLSRTSSLNDQHEALDQKLCDTSNPSDTEQVKLVQEQIRARNQAATAKPAQTSGDSPVSRSSGSGNCHWVNGYTRKNGTHVRGHTRCQ